MKGLSSLSALKEAPESTAATLDGVARAMLASTPDCVLAQARFAAAVAANPALVAQLFEIETIRREAAKWFAAFARQNPAQAGGGGHLAGAKAGRNLHAASNPTGAEGHMLRVHTDQATVADHSQSQDGKGHCHPARNGHAGDANAIDPPERGDARKLLAEPSPSHLEIIRRAAGRAAQHTARSAFESFRVRDGRGIGDVRLGELRRLRVDNTQEAAVLRQIERHVSSAIEYSPQMPVREAIGEEMLNRFIQLGAKEAHAD